MIRPGSPAPDFTLPSNEGSFTLSEQRGRQVVVYFYPRDLTPGCTLEGQEFTALAEEFAAAGTEVVGISKDSLGRHANFCASAGIRLRLLSDEGSDVSERWGVWQQKKMAGREYLGIVRSTFLIGRDGTVLKVWSPVRVPGHAQAVLEDARAAAAQ